MIMKDVGNEFPSQLDFEVIVSILPAWLSQSTLMGGGYWGHISLTDPWGISVLLR